MEEVDNSSATEEAEAFQLVERSGSFHGLTFEASCRTPNTIKIKIHNDSSDGYSLGWVEGPALTCVTDSGEFLSTMPAMQVGAGETKEFNAAFDDAEGAIQKLSISNVMLLASSGLPTGMNGETVDILFSGDVTNSEDAAQEEASVVLSGSGNYNGLSIEVSGTAKAVKVTYVNHDSTGYSLGWVQGPSITCTTTEGEFYYTAAMSQIPAGGNMTENYYFDDASGDLLSLTISGINQLNEMGLPSDFSGGGYVTISVDGKEI